MTPALATRPQSDERAQSTLEERLSAILQQVRAGSAAECPVCGGEMEADGPGGGCLDCRARLS